MDTDSVENDARAQVEATSEQGERAAATLLARLHGIAEQFAERTAPQLPTSLQQPARDHAVPTFVACVLLTLACAIAVVRLLSAKPKRKTVLLCGPMGGGATTLWHALQQHPLPHGTVTSMQENDAICAPIPGVSRSVRLVDVPGHPRLRAAVRERSRTAAAVVFVLDAADFIRQKADVAGQLFEVLTALAATPRRVPVVVACNKSDLGAKAFNDAFIVKQLEKEIATLIETRSAKLGQGAQATDAGLAALARAAAAQPFTLQGSRLVSVQVCRVSAATGDVAELLPALQKAV